MLKKKLIFTGWCLLAAALVFLLITAMRKKENKTVSDIKVEVIDAEEHVFVDEKEVVVFLNKMGISKETELYKINVRHLEEGLEKNTWVKKADLFFDNDNVLHVTIHEREPLARIFTINGSSFYIDSSGKRLPLSDKLSARVPVFTSFPSSERKLSAPDSLVLNDVRQLAQFIAKDSFWMRQISQVDITPQRTFELIPVLGNQVIAIGDTNDLEGKFDRLYSFYKQVWTKAGFEKYETIDVRFNGQVVASRRGAAKPNVDSLRAAMQLADNVARMNNAMADSSVVGRNEVKPAVDSAGHAAVVPASTTKPNKVAATTKPAAKKTTAKPAGTKPRAVMKKTTRKR
jgi:cell division protein FtsQ